MDVYIATLGGIARERQNLKAKNDMRSEIWELLRNSKEGKLSLSTLYSD
jgi:hypothetical protein